VATAEWRSSKKLEGRTSRVIYLVLSCLEQQIAFVVHVATDGRLVLRVLFSQLHSGLALGEAKNSGRARVGFTVIYTP